MILYLQYLQQKLENNKYVDNRLGNLRHTYLFYVLCYFKKNSM